MEDVEELEAELQATVLTYFPSRTENLRKPDIIHLGIITAQRRYVIIGRSNRVLQIARVILDTRRYDARLARCQQREQQ